MNFNFVNCLYLFSYYYLIKTTQLQFDWYYSECAIKKLIHVNICKYFQNMYCMIVYLYMHNNYTQYTHIYYVNKNFYFGCD